MSKKRNEKAPDHWSQIVGQPDQWDKENLTRLINNFKKRKFKLEGQVITGRTYIELVVAEARQSHNTLLGDKYNLKSKDSDMRALTAIPPELGTEISESYPTMFRSREHSIWFAKNFPEFRLARVV